MADVLMANYDLLLTVNMEQIKEKLAEGETFDEYIAKNFFRYINDKLEELGIEGGVGFPHYAHMYKITRE